MKRNSWTLRRIDRYIIRQFLGTYVFSLLLIIAITVVFDVNERLDNFLKPEVSLHAIVADYYLNFIPYFVGLFSPLFTFVSVIYFTSKLADRSEIIALLSSGVSFNRLLRPYLISAAIIALGSYLLNAYIIPPANETRIEFQNTYFKNKKVEYARNIQLEVEPGIFAYFDNYRADSYMG
ncbi:MAG: LptF/LptG family permease, partial [Tannerella sp.]|nr:LptF/LptG family permease [Tannerella sp.]